MAWRAWTSEGPDRSQASHKLCQQQAAIISGSSLPITDRTNPPVIDWCNLQANEPVRMFSHEIPRLFVSAYGDTPREELLSDHCHVYRQRQEATELPQVLKPIPRSSR